MSDIKEIVTDITAALVVLSVPYQSIALIQIDPAFLAFAGIAGMYLFGKYTPNSA